MSTEPVDHNNERWSGFFLSEADAQKALEAMCKKQAENFRIVSAKKELLRKKKDAYLLYKFTIIKALFDK
jgi:hypothetical protein